MKHHKKQYRRILIGMLLLGSTAAIMNACAWDDSLYQEFVIEDDEGGHVVSCGDVLDKIIIYSDDGTMNTYNKYNAAPPTHTDDNDGTMISDDNDGTQDAPISSEGMFANAFAYNLCPRAAPNCMIEEISDKEAPEDTSLTNFICHNCLANYNVCKDKCVDISQENLHIDDCILDNLTCENDYYDFNDDSSDGCEFQLSKNHVKENDAGTLVCAEDYFDLNDDLNNDDSSDGCEFRLSPVNIDKNRPQTEGSWNCLDGYADIDEDPYNGCEINGWTDNMHCGAGGISKQNPIEGEECKPGHVCTGGECKVSCGKDYILVCVDQCSNTKIDKDHCGECNIKCEINEDNKVSHAAVACQGGGCHAIACQPGYYLAAGENKDKEGNNIQTCKPCADGKYTTSATATVEECIDCPETTGVASMVFDADENICKATSCLAGYVLNDGSCKPCEAGTVPWGESCFPCNANNISGLAASSCTPCPAGTHTVGDDRTKCEELDCSSGYHVHVNDCEKDDMTNCGAHGNECVQLNHGEAACINGQCVYTCHAGYYWQDSCGDSEGKCCKPCPAGSYCPTAGLTSPIDCPKGHYCTAGSSKPTACSAGTSQNNTRMTSQSSCTTCGEKKISTAGSATCAECKGNTRANSDHTACVGCNQTNDASDNDGCVKTTGAKTMKCENNVCKADTCNAGYKLNNGQCEPCAAGEVSDNGSCKKCQAGTYANATNNTCTNCPAGSYCPTAGLTSPIPCPKGHYCTEGKSSPAPCPMGTYRDQPNGTKEGDCSNCPKGRHNDGVGAYECALIPAGYIGVNCRDITNYNGCTQYARCDDDNSAFKCSNTYGNKSLCVNGYCMDTTQTTSTSCIADNNGCPAVACCNGACATNNDKCGSCDTKCTGNKTCKFSDNTWKCQ